MQTKVTLLDKDGQDLRRFKVRVEGDGSVSTDHVMDTLRDSLAPAYGCETKLSGRIVIEFKDAYIRSLDCCAGNKGFGIPPDVIADLSMIAGAESSSVTLELHPTTVMEEVE